MLKGYVRALLIATLAGCLLPALTIVCSRIDPKAERRRDEPWTETRRAIDAATWGAFGVASWFGIRALLRRFDKHLSERDEPSIEFAQPMTPRWISAAIVASAATSLLLELAMIRWQGEVFELFSYYKNLSLLACFLGLGIGYSLAPVRQLSLLIVAPLVAFQFALLPLLRHALRPEQRVSITNLPVVEQFGMGIAHAGSVFEFVAVYGFLVAIFALTVLTFVPVGQVCGRFMNRTRPLKAYGLNLAGSALGVCIMLLLSDRCAPPIVWFGIALVAIACFQPQHSGDRPIALVGILAAICLLAWPHSIGWEQIHSPYQLLERGPGEHGLSQIRASGQYYQRIHNLADSVVETTREEGIKLTAAYYEFPYRVLASEPKHVAIVGAGTGNDVAAALRRGAAQVDAVEIDPVIIELGRLYHPENPYGDRRVRVVVDDARTFLRSTPTRYDLIVYGLLDSHTLLSHASNVRLDSFVYTVEGLREARNRLAPGGMLALSFSVMSPELGRKIELMLTEAFSGRAPVCVRGRYNYDGSTIFLATEDREIALPTEFMATFGFQEISKLYAESNLSADVSTDDWPFFYMPKRVYPLSYLFMLGLVLAAGVALLASLAPALPSIKDGGFFFLGAGFMLIQTKGVTELGLLFGNTWQVIGIVILAMLSFAAIANFTVARYNLRDSRLLYPLLLASLWLGWYWSGAGPRSGIAGGKWTAAALVTSPVFFSGIIFSALLARTQQVSKAMSANLLGALCGGLLEYHSMYFGFRALYIIAAILYILAFACSLVRRSDSLGAKAASETQISANRSSPKSGASA